MTMQYQETKNIPFAVLKKHPDNEKLLPPLSQDERQSLAKKMKDELEPQPFAVIQNCDGYLILDGNNRFDILLELGFSGNVPCVIKRPMSIEEQRTYIENCALSRRNLTKEQKVEIAKRQVARGLNVRDVAEKLAVSKTWVSDNTSEVLEARKESQQEAVAMLRKEGMTQEAVAEMVGVTHKTISNIENSFGNLSENGQITKTETKESEGTMLQKDADLIREPELGNVEAKAKALLDEDEILKRAQQNKKIKAHVSYNSGNNEWFTPPEYIEAARETMGGIDLDPASCEIANRVVNAGKFFSQEDDGIEQEWFGKVWLNPPYSSSLLSSFIEKLIASYEEEAIETACVLVNNITETTSGQLLLSKAQSVCFPRGRIKFLNGKLIPNGSPLQGQMIVYFGKNQKGFKKNFSKFGVVL